MKVDILVHVEDPGAVNFLKSLPEILLGLGLNVVMICQGVAASTFRDHACFYPVKTETAGEILDQLDPVLIIVGTSENPNSLGLMLVEEAHNLGIYSIGMVDMFCNADKRFRGNSDDAFKYCPNELFLPDDSTKNQFLDLGAPAQKLTVVGNPAYKNALNFREKMEQSGFVRETVSLNKTRLRILFIAEGWDKLNLDASRINSNYSLYGRGSSDFKTIIAMEELVDSLARAGKEFHTTLRLHPNSEYADFMDIAQEFDDVSVGGDVYELCWGYDLVVGMASMLVLEAALLGIPTLSILPDSSEKRWMPNLDIGPTTCVSVREDLDVYWSESSFINNDPLVPNWGFGDSTAIMAARIQGLLRVNNVT
jgi:hypothetical protein